MSEKQNIGRRVKKLRQALEMNQPQFAAHMGFSRNYISMVEGGRDPGPRFMKQLETLEKGMLTSEQYPDREEMGRTGDGKFPNVRHLAQKMRYSIAPIIAYARGGEGSYPIDIEHAAPKIPVPCSDPNCYVLELDGDSMEPIYNAGDLLVVAPNTPAVNNDLVIVKTTDDEVFFKILKHPKKGEIFEFHSYNPKHPPMHLRPDQIFRVSVVDTVIKPLKRKWRAMTVSESAAL